MVDSIEVNDDVYSKSNATNEATSSIELQDHVEALTPMQEIPSKLNTSDRVIVKLKKTLVIDTSFLQRSSHFLTLFETHSQSMVTNSSKTYSLSQINEPQYLILSSFAPQSLVHNKAYLY